MFFPRKNENKIRLLPVKWLERAWTPRIRVDATSRSHGRLNAAGTKAFQAFWLMLNSQPQSASMN